MKMLPCFLIVFLPLCAWGQEVDTASIIRQVDSLIRVSRTLGNNRDFEQALALNATAEKLVLEKLGRETTAYGTVCYYHARVLHIKKDYTEAEKWYFEARDIRRKILGKEHRGYAQCCYSLATFYYEVGNIKKVEPYLLEALPIYEKVLGKGDPLYYQGLRLQGMVYRDLGLYEKAEQLMLEVKNILEKTTGKNHPDYALCLNSLANLYVNMGLYETAEQVYNEANAVTKEVLGERHTQYLRGLLGLATLYQRLGNFEKAVQLIRGVQSLCNKSSDGQEHPFTIKILNLLGEIYTDKLENEKAEKYYLEGKAIKEKENLRESSEYANLLHSLADLYRDKRDYEKSKQLFLEAGAIFEKTLGAQSFEYTINLYKLAELYADMSNFEKAESFFLEAKTSFEKAFKKDHPSYVTILNGLSIFYERQKRYSLSEPLLTEMFSLEQLRLSKAVTFLSERELAIYTVVFQQRLDNLGSHIVTRFRDHENTGVLPALAYNNALFHKGFLLNAAASLKNLSSLSPTSMETNTRLKSYRRLLAAEFAKPVARRDSTNVAELEENANNLEKELAHTVAGYSEAIRQVTWPEVKSALKQDEAAVEFVHYRYAAPEATDSTIYAALILRPGDAQPLFVPLFEEKELMLRLTGATGGNNFLKINALYAAQKVVAAQKSLYELIWQPLDSLLSGSQTVYCSPSGLLHRLNLSAITDPKGKTFGDNHQLVILGSTRQLVVPTSPQTNTNSAYFAGGIRYDTDSTALFAANINTASRSIEQPEPLHFSTDSISATRGTVLEYLPASGAEVQEIGKMLRTAGFTATVDTGFYATEENFRKLGVGSSSPRIIHLATHGYFFPDPKTLFNRRLITDGSEPVFKTSDHPMIRSGLILAGAKQTWLMGTHLAGFEDGILTAYEISQMNLSGTELVVLSACETGLGDIIGNEGVYGLQRAFKIAGAKYLIMSLWKVDDRSTQAFMTAFYRHWLTEKQRIPQAFQTAQREMREKYPGAYDWAGFVLIE